MNEDNIEKDEALRIQSVVGTYLRDRKGWADDDFQVVVRDVIDDSKTAVCDGIFLEDLKKAMSGEARSVQVHVDREAMRIIAEFAFQ